VHGGHAPQAKTEARPGGRTALEPGRHDGRLEACLSMAPQAKTRVKGLYDDAARPAFQESFLSGQQAFLSPGGPAALTSATARHGTPSPCAMRTAPPPSPLRREQQTNANRVGRSASRASREALKTPSRAESRGAVQNPESPNFI
jgi:hypothetical protein